MINLKSNSEIERMREAGKIVRDTLLLMETLVKPGVTTKELDRAAYKYITSCKATPSFLNYNGYPASICASIDEEVVHGIPSGRRIEEGQIVSIDVGACIGGFHGDAARTFAAGRVSPLKEKLMKVTEQSFFKGIEQFKEGNRLGDISAAVQQYAEANGFSVVRALVGHGIGRKMHEDPAVPNYGMPGRGLRLEKGLVLAIEPMINAGTYEVAQLEDGWTIVTEDDMPSAHYENTVALTENGLEILTL
ncbi:MAG TPA: type I methionyl aminopeptidase [Candidatus Faecicola pullistercoris]|nr:type I methionyl aminopeptidase [Candidatus Faecicola pullistercoris]